VTAEKPIFEARVVDARGVPTVALIGELDLLTGPELSCVLGEVTKTKPQALRLDLTELTFMDSTGIGIFVTTFKQLQAHDAGAQLIVSRANPRIHKLLELSGLTKLFTIEP
jgi:anti-sigma B factor antagonist